MTTKTAAIEATEWTIPGTDRVISAGNNRETLRRERVIKVSGTVITTTVGRYNRSTGAEIGVQYPTEYLLKPSPEAMDKLARGDARRMLRSELLALTKGLATMSDGDVATLLAKLKN